MRQDLMDRFPPSAGSQVTLANWRTEPFNRWAFHHVREIVPSADIAHDPARVRALPVAGGALDGLHVPDGQGKPMSLARFLETTSTDGLVVLHRGAIVLEHYANGMTARSPHILMSVSKSMLGLLAAVLAGRGVLDPARQVTDIIPEVRDTAWAGARVSQLLDMRAGVFFDEDYLATSGPIVDYRKSTGWNPLGPGETASDLRTFFRQMTKPDGDHGGSFSYVSPNTDLLGWILERVAGKRYADLMSDLVWRPMGAAEPAYITIDRLGAPRCAGGMCATTRDLARVGQLLVEDGAWAGTQVAPAAWIDDIARNGDPKAWNAGSFAPYYPGADMHYRDKWYVERGPHPVLFGMGIHGQNLVVDRNNQIVIAKFSSQPPPIDAELIALTGRFVTQVRRTLGA